MPAAVMMCPFNPGHGILMSVDASHAEIAGVSLVTANTAMTRRYGNRAMKMRPPSSFTAPLLSCSWGSAARSLSVMAASSASRSACSEARASAPPWGCQNRRNSTATPRPTSEAMMSVSSTEIQVAAIHWKIANVRPTTTAIGQVWRTPRRPPAMRTSRSGTKAARMGVWWPTYAPISW